MSDGFYVLQDCRFVYVNEAFERLLGAHAGELLGRRFDDFVHPEEREDALQRYKRRIAGEKVIKHFEVRLLKADGKSSIDAWLEVDTLMDDNQQMAVAGTVRDISSFNELKEELSQARQQLTTIMDNMSDTVYQTNMAGEVTLMSSCVEALLGYSPEEMIGQKLADYYWSPEERQKVIDAITKNNGVVTNVEAVLRRKDDTPVWISTNAYIKKNEQGEPVSIEGIARDVTVQKELEQKLEKLALTDSLTALPNRRALMDELHHCYMHSRAKNTDLSIVYFDINGFKKVNDEFGHLIGDNLLVHVAITMRSHVSDSKIFGRLSGDEFLFILPGVDSDLAQQFAHRLYEDVSIKPLRQQGRDIPVSIAIGISSGKQDDQSEYSLLDRADKAMYLAKRGGQPFEVL
jgi:diguanylate cyclase (GGDEF)-like protein/PAS domain S-box-containing protein